MKFLVKESGFRSKGESVLDNIVRFVVNRMGLLELDPFSQM